MSNRRRPRNPKPERKRSPAGRVFWRARYPKRDGSFGYAKPSWNRGKGSFNLRGDAQTAIDEAMDREWGMATRFDTVGAYSKGWLKRWPRSERTNEGYAGRLDAVLDVELEGLPLRDWPMVDLRQKHAYDLVEHMLVEQGRAHRGVRTIISTLRAMFKNAITDQCAEVNPFADVEIRGNDPRIQKAARKPRVWPIEQMHEFARQAAVVRKWRPKERRWEVMRQDPMREAMVRTLSDCGLRLEEMFALERARFDGRTLTLEGTAYEGRILPSTEEKNHDREVPVPPTLAQIIFALPPRIDTKLLYPTLTGLVWRKRNFYRDVWYPTCAVMGIDPTPHDFRHSYDTHLMRAGIDPADVASRAGHQVETMMKHYYHALGESDDKIREVFG